MFGYDDVKFALPDDKVCKWDGVRDIIVIVPINNGGCGEVPVDEAGNELDDVLVTEIP